jgi:anti-sigma factor RsiW
MTQNHDAPNHDRQPSDGNDNKNSFVETERFELLSAYLDGELTTQERQQVQQWLNSDPQFQQLYQRLLKLRHQMQNISVPATNTSTEQFGDRVLQSIDRRRSKRRLWTLAGGAIAAMFVASVVGVWTNGDRGILQFARSSSENKSSEPLMVAVSIDKPAVTIPKAAKASSRSLRLIK